MGRSENRIRAVQMGPRTEAIPVSGPPVERGLPFPAVGGGPGGSITVYPTGHPEGISGPEFLAEIQEDERRRPLGRERRLTPEPEFSGREEFEARGRAAQMGPSLPPGAVAGPGAEEQITLAQVAQFLGRMPYRNAGHGPGEALEGVRVQDPRRMPREAPPAREKTPPTVKVTRPNPDKDRFGEAVPMDRALAAQEADRERTQSMMDQQIAAGRRGEEAARARGFKGQQDRQDRTLERTQAGGRDLLRGQWERRMIDRYKAVANADFIEDLYSRYSKDEKGNPRTHAETVKAIAASGELRQLRNRQGLSGAMATQQERDAAVAANAKQYHEARKMAGPQGRAMLANTMIGAQNPFDLARAAAGAHALDPNAGWGNLAMGMGAEAANAEAVQGLGNGNRTPMDRMREDHERNVANRPIGERAQAYRDQYKAKQGGQLANPEAENMHLIQAGSADASGAASNIISGAGQAGDEAFLREWTLAFISKEGTGSNGFQKWASRLGIAQTEEAMSLWSNLTNTSGRTVYQWLGESFGFNPVPSVKDKKGAPAKKPAPAKAPPGRGWRPVD